MCVSITISYFIFSSEKKWKKHTLRVRYFLGNGQAWKFVALSKDMQSERKKTETKIIAAIS